MTRAAMRCAGRLVPCECGAEQCVVLCNCRRIRTSGSGGHGGWEAGTLRLWPVSRPRDARDRAGTRLRGRYEVTLVETLFLLELEQRFENARLSKPRRSPGARSNRALARGRISQITASLVWTKGHEMIGIGNGDRRRAGRTGYVPLHQAILGYRITLAPIISTN